MSILALSDDYLMNGKLSITDSPVVETEEQNGWRYPHEIYAADLL
jgi:hypothetical protein